jgi:acetyl/propionyl-CoA carboxylase alpha subunit
MKYLIFGLAALLAGECALAQTTAPAATQPAPATAPSEPAKKDAATQPAPVKGAAAAKSVGTKDMTVKADAYQKAQEKKRAAMARKIEAKGGGDPKNKTKTAAADDSLVRSSSMMTDDERAAHRKKLQSFNTLAECEAYEKQHEAEMETRAKAQHKTLRAPSGGACNRYKVAAGAAVPTAGTVAPK